MANPLMTLLKPREQQIAESYVNQIGQGDRGAQDRLNQYLGEQEAAQDPYFADKYAQTGAAQTQEDIYSRPGQEQQRQDALEQILIPIREKGALDIARQGVANQGLIGQADIGYQRALASQQGQAARSNQSQAGQFQRQRNTQLESQAKAAEGSTRNPWEWLMPQVLGGAPSPADQAAAIRAQQQFGVPTEAGAGQAQDSELLAAVAQALQAQGIDPSYADQVITDPEAMAELGF